MAKSMMEIGAELKDYCEKNDTYTGLEKLYAADAVSVEAVAMEGTDSPVSEGLDAIRGKHAWWDENFTVHSASIEGPFPHGDDRFALIFEMDAENNASKERHTMKEVAVYTVSSNKIVKEEFFYPFG